MRNVIDASVRSLTSHNVTTRPPRHSVLPAALALCVTVAGACADSPYEVGPTDAVEWSDFGFLPSGSDVSSVAVFRGAIYVGTSDGVYRRPLAAGGTWEPTGIGRQLDVRALGVSNASTPALYAAGYPRDSSGAAFYRTTDGTRWAPGAGPRSSATGHTLGLGSLAIQAAARGGAPPTLYASATGANIARFVDEGATWQIVAGRTEEATGSDCVLHVTGDLLFQGCETPIDVAWVRRFDVLQRNRATLDEGTIVVDGIGNRRVNGFFEFPQIASAAPALYVGVEGGLLVLETTGAWRWVREFPIAAEGPYPYVRAVWVDPADPAHIVFGGGESQYASVRSGLFETRDAGKTVAPARGPAGVDLSRVGVPASTPTGSGGRDLLMVVDDGRVRRVLLRSPRG